MENVKKKLADAQNKALKGDIDGAEMAYSSLANAGLLPAVAAVAEIHAFRGRWDLALRNVEKVIASPQETDTFNVYSDAMELAARASSETGRWKALLPAVRKALIWFAKDEGDYALVEGLEDLRAYVEEANPTAVFSMLLQPDDDAKENFDEALKEIDESPNEYDSAEERLDDLFALASVYDYESGALELFDRGEAIPPSFDNAVFLAGALASDGRSDTAWEAIATTLCDWYPVEASQVAPVILLTHPSLRSIMTPERCATVLRTPRGPFG